MNLYYIPLDEGGLNHWLGDYIIIMSEDKESAKEKLVNYHKEKIDDEITDYGKNDVINELKFALENFEKWEVIEDGIWDSFLGE